MKNTASKKKTCLGFLLIVFLAYVVCYLLSQTVFHEVYLFEWTAAHYYLCLWVASVTFCFLEMYRAALITTAGNWTGILIGQVLGDFIIKINATKITPDMYIGKVWQLKGNRQISRRIKKHLWLSNRSWARDVHSFGILHSWGALAGKSCSAQASSIWLIAGAFRRTQSK